ncbi:MAG: hypothetical protein EBS90_09040 [Betaproteobacteria bacterium]|nr:hypothetical protein [Betaproteobacteria bacterium]
MTKTKQRFPHGKPWGNEPCVNWLIVDTVEIAPVIYKPTPFRGWVIDNGRLQKEKGNEMTEHELLLTDEFVEFSKAVAAVHEEKKVLEEDFKKHFEDYKSKKKDLENKVAAASTKWEEWKKSQLSAKK